MKNNIYKFTALKKKQEEQKQAKLYNKLVKEMIEEFNRVLHPKK